MLVLKGELCGGPGAGVQGLGFKGRKNHLARTQSHSKDPSGLLRLDEGFRRAEPSVSKLLRPTLFG